MPKIEFEAKTITTSDFEDDFNSTWMKDLDGNFATHEDKIYNRRYDVFKPVSEAGFADRNVWHGFSRAQIILMRERSEAMLGQASSAIVKMNRQFEESPFRHLKGSGKTVSVSFGSHETGRYSVGCEVGPDLKSCSRITIDEYIFKNPNWNDPGPYFDVNTYVFGAGSLLNENLSFSSELTKAFSNWADLLK